MQDSAHGLQADVAHPAICSAGKNGFTLSRNSPVTGYPKVIKTDAYISLASELTHQIPQNHHIVAALYQLGRLQNHGRTVVDVAKMTIDLQTSFIGNVCNVAAQRKVLVVQTASEKRVRIA